MLVLIDEVAPHARDRGARRGHLVFPL